MTTSQPVVGRVDFSAALLEGLPGSALYPLFGHLSPMLWEKGQCGRVGHRRVGGRHWVTLTDAGFGDYYPDVYFGLDPQEGKLENRNSNGELDWKYGNGSENWMNDELARAVKDVLNWMNTTPESAGAALGINTRTLAAMGEGHVPMRSLVIRFADGVRQRCDEVPGAPEWWRDTDAWLRVAGFHPRRDGGPPERRPPNQERPIHPPPPPRSPEMEELAGTYYRPRYERQPWGTSFLHIFWLDDPNGQPVFQRSMRPDYDYKAEAARLKQDLARLSRFQFERKYSRYRINNESQNR